MLGPRSLRTVATTMGPMSSAPTTASSSLLIPRSGVKTKKTIARAGMFIVADPWTIAMAPARPALLWKAEETGTIHAEQRFMIGPAAAPLRVREKVPPDWNHLPAPAGNRKALRNSCYQEGEDHPNGHQAQVRNREGPPFCKEAGAGFPVDAESLEALHPRSCDGIEVLADNVQLGEAVQDEEKGQDYGKEENAGELFFFGSRWRTTISHLFVIIIPDGAHRWSAHKGQNGESTRFYCVFNDVWGS